MNMTSRVYFAGKIAKGDWRTDFTGYSGATINSGSCGEICSEEAWEWNPFPLESTFGDFLYVGPFFIGDDHGCMHGDNTHAYGITHEWYEQEANERRKRVSHLCLEAIKQSDIVFAWLEDETCYGSIAELGYAKALNKKIWIASPERLHDLWFVYEMADRVLVGNNEPSLAFKFFTYCETQTLV